MVVVFLYFYASASDQCSLSIIDANGVGNFMEAAGRIQ